MLWVSLQLDQISQTSLDYNSFFLALVEQLLLSVCQWVSISKSVHLKVVNVLDVLSLGVHSEVVLAVLQSWVHGWPGWHEELLLVGADIDDAILVLHQMLEAWGSIEHWWDRYG